MEKLKLEFAGESENLPQKGQSRAGYPAFPPGDARQPYFRTHGQTYRIKVGDPVTMTCKVENLGSSVIVWKQTDRIISAGERLIRKDPRMRLVKEPNGISLHITHVTPDDRGSYICELETYGEPIHQTNVLDVLGKLQLFQMLPTGEKEREGSSLVLPNVTRLESGTYICRASNGVDRPVEAKIELHVIYEPEIQIDKAWVHADIGVEVEISCIVHSRPDAEVKWYLATMLLDPNENRLMEKFGIRHSLVIHKARKSDFGNYSCSAENKLGRSRAFIEVSGHPNRANITSRALSYHSDRYNLTWTVFSYSEISQYRILYRKVIPENDPNYDTRSRWHNIVQFFNPRVTPLQDMGYMFYALEPHSQYEVIITCQNQWGWSKNSSPFFFSTRSTDFSPKVDASQPKGHQPSEILVDDSSLSSASGELSSSATKIGDVSQKTAKTMIPIIMAYSSLVISNTFHLGV
ncbi:hypothetical protein TCAL_12442 [Tigriopus californicus]|uniref:Ig-like domain-containing protein n=1 Tax=Tigriopus californicus TaxID=6832 RepID=A0A553PKD0_TIGCA|nr:hypothetical protein TCAL_12442 [Tigriopus californicus]